MKALLALEDGTTYPCESFTGEGEASGEVVFNTSMTGYQETLTDPSYRGQMVTMTYPLVGNYGVNLEDVESNRIQVAAFLIREYQSYPSNYRSTSSLRDYLRAADVLGVENLDTRALTRHIRTAGAMRAVISTRDPDPERLVQLANQIPTMQGLNLTTQVSTRTPYYWEKDRVSAVRLQEGQSLDETVWRQRRDKLSVVAVDFGIKYNILRCLEATGFEVVVVPGNTPAETIKAMGPDGIFLSNGPGDPEPVTDGIETIRQLLGYRPIFGICLGHQLMGLALGGSTFKLKFGHRGANQPVKHLATGKIEITSQNHGFAVDLESFRQKDVEITHINLNDNTLEGFRYPKLRVRTVQYHPEASPGPHDARYLFDDFKQMIKRAA